MSSALFSPLTLRGLTLPNRIVVSPMCQYNSVDGSATDWHLMHLGSLAMGAAGLLMVEMTNVTMDGRISPRCATLCTERNEQELKRIVDFCRTYGTAKLGVQLAHAGRKGSQQPPAEGGKPLTASQGAWQTVAPSALPYAENWPEPRAPFSARIRAEADIVTMTVGLIDKPRQAEEIIASGQADMVALARGALYDPRWAWHAAEELGCEIAYPPKYRVCHPSLRPQLFSHRRTGGD
ncbi:MAG: hypothetical protein M3O41_12210 [Pseudomonadota bacterium]|nr:hypothetical protein [Pseudomonadota bacterium]